MAYRATDKTREKKAGTRQRILEECYQLVSQFGFRGVSVSEVAKRSGIATGSIYGHFPSKADLIAEVFRFCSQHEVKAVADVASGSGTPSERLQRAVVQFSTRAIQGGRLAYALIAEPVDPLVEKERLAYRYAYAEIFEDLITEGIQCGEFIKQDTSISAPAIVGLLAEVLLEPLASKEAEINVQNNAEPDADFITAVVQLVNRTVGVMPSNVAL